MRALCIFTNILGHKSNVQRLVAALGRIEDLDLTCVLIGDEDYARYPAPRWARLTHPWEGQFVARQKVGELLEQPFDILLVNAWELVVAFRDLARRIPAAALIIDCVPATMDSQLRLQGRTGWKRSLAHWVHHRAFAKAVPAFDFLAPKSTECSVSLQRDYGARPEQCFVTLAVQRVDSWKPKTSGRSYSLPIRLLFVGNDFARKGGELLLSLFSEHMAGICMLRIASNDPALAGRRLPPGVELLRGRNREQLMEVYQDSDIFLLPTHQDFTPEVVGEALAMGLPCFVSEVDGVRDMIRNGDTGYVMPRGAGAAEWAEQLRALVSEPAELTRMSSSARTFAEEHLSFDRFETLIGDIVERLRAKTAPPQAETRDGRRGAPTEHHAGKQQPASDRIFR